MTEDENYALKNHSTSIKNGNANLLPSSGSNISSHNQSSSSNPRPKKISKTAVKHQSSAHFQSNSTSTSSSSFDPYYNSYPTSYVPPSYSADVTTASFLEAATTNYTNNGTNPNDLLLVNESNPYSGTYSNYYAAALQQQYQNTLAPYHAVYYQDTTSRYYPNHRGSPTINENNYQSHHHHQQGQQQQQQQQQQQSLNHENYLMDSAGNNNSYSYYLYNKTPSVANHGHDSNNNLSLFDVSISAPIHHSVIKHCAKR